MERRRFVTIAAAATTALIAGCTDPGEDGEDDDSVPYDVGEPGGDP